MSTQVDPTITQAAGGANGSPTDWRATLPDELKSEKSLEKYKGVPDLAKAYVEASKMMGSATKVPKADAKPEEWDAFYSKIGRPESPDKYELKHPESEKGGKYDEALEKEVRAHAHANGLTAIQTQKEMDWLDTRNTEQLAEFHKTLEGEVGKLRTEWGADFDKKVGFSQSSVKEFGGDEFIKALDVSGLGNHPLLIKYSAAVGNEIAGLRAKIAELTGENRLILGDGNNNSDGADAVKLKIHEIENDPKHPYNDNRAPHAAREAAIRQVSELYKQLHPPASEAA